jgi:hypothetical protein
MKTRIRSLDAIGRAFKREREAGFWPVWQPEALLTIPGAFRCVCCGRSRRGDQRREPQSEVCVICVVEAGFRN